MTLQLDEKWYVEAYPHVSHLGLTAREHYLKFGQKLGYLPNRNYLEIDTDVKADLPAVKIGAGVTGIDQTSEPIIASKNVSKFFSRDYYLECHPDILEAGIDPLVHYLNDGWREGRCPNAWFSPRFYLSTYNDVAASGLEPLTHYINSGRSEGRYPSYSAFHADRAKRISKDPCPTQLLPIKKTPSQNIVHVPKICVHIHCYYIDVFEATIIDWLLKIPYIPTLFISVCFEQDIEKVKSLLQDLPLKIGRIALVENRGRDLAPLICEFGAEISGYELCLHVHTKKSKEKLDFGSAWLKDIAHTFFLNADYVSNVVDHAVQNKDLGIISPRPYSGVIPFMVWGANKELVNHLLQRAKLRTEHPDKGTLRFPAGSMFWFRPDALATLFQMGLQPQDFPAEPIADDGTLAHAIERALPDFCASAGYQYKCVAPVAPEANWPSEMEPVVSVIIPCYNAEKWIEDAVNSVIQQDAYHCPIEIIVIDNNSSDNSASIVKKMADINPRIRFFNQIKQGAGATRNLGLEMSRGQYITFLDADDLLMSNCLSLLYDAMLVDSEGDVDFVTSSLVMFDHDRVSRSMPFPDIGTYTILDKSESDDNADNWRIVFGDFGPCAKLYRKEFLVKNDIYFPEEGNFEDNFFISSVYLKCKKSVIVNATTYLYRRTETDHGKTQSSAVSIRAMHDQFRVAESIIVDINASEPNPYAKLYVEELVKKVEGEMIRMGLGEPSYHALNEFPHLRLAIIDRHIHNSNHVAGERV